MTRGEEEGGTLKDEQEFRGKVGQTRRQLPKHRSKTLHSPLAPCEAWQGTDDGTREGFLADRLSKGQSSEMQAEIKEPMTDSEEWQAQKPGEAREGTRVHPALMSSRTHTAQESLPGPRSAGKQFVHTPR